MSTRWCNGKATKEEGTMPPDLHNALLCKPFIDPYHTTNNSLGEVQQNSTHN